PGSCGDVDTDVDAARSGVHHARGDLDVVTEADRPAEPDPGDVGGDDVRPRPFAATRVRRLVDPPQDLAAVDGVPTAIGGGCEEAPRDAECGAVGEIVLGGHGVLDPGARRYPDPCLALTLQLEHGDRGPPRHLDGGAVGI